MTLLKNLERTLKLAIKMEDGQIYREWIDSFKQTQVDFERNLRFLYSSIKVDPSLSIKYKDFQKKKIEYFSNVNNNGYLSDSDIEFLTIVEFCNIRGNKTLTMIWKNYFGYNLLKVFR